MSLIDALLTCKVTSCIQAIPFYAKICFILQRSTVAVTRVPLILSITRKWCY